MTRAPHAYAADSPTFPERRPQFSWGQLVTMGLFICAAVYGVAAFGNRKFSELQKGHEHLSRGQDLIYYRVGQLETQFKEYRDEANPSREWWTQPREAKP